VWRIDLTNNTTPGGKLATGDMGSYFQNYTSFSGMTLSPNGATLVTCNTVTHNATIIDTATWSVAGTVGFGAGNSPVRAVFSPDSSKIYMTLRDTDRIAVLQNSGGWVTTGFITVGDAPVEMVMNASGSRIYVQNTGTGTNVGVVDTAAMSQIATIPLTPNPTIDGMALSPDGSRLYVSHSNGSYTIGNGALVIAQGNVLSVVDTATNSQIDSVSGPNLAAGLAIAPNGSWLGMPNLMSEGMTLVSLGTPCYANCDGSTTAPILNVADFTCFLNKFASADPYANCDGSTTSPVLNVADFTCFLNK
jgi:DNA-binding beta-propeller fold protein YncE